MAFKFFKDMLASIKEGVDQANADEAKEEDDALAEKNEQETAAVNRKQTLLAKFELISMREKFYTALGAPYREVFIHDLSNAETQQRPAYYLCAMDIPDADKKDIAQFIDRDFGVTDKASLQKTAAQTELMVYLLSHPDLFDFLRLQLGIPLHGEPDTDDVEQVGDAAEHICAALNQDHAALTHLLSVFRTETRYLGADFPDDKLGLLALWMSRLSYMASTSAALGYVTQPEALSMLTNIVGVGLVKIHGWKQFGELFVQGDKQDGSNNVLGRKILARQVTRLLAESRSPWIELEWPINQLALEI